MQSFDKFTPVGEAIVEVKRSVGGKPDESHKQLSAKAAVIDEHIDSCIGVLENSSASVSCWLRSSSIDKMQAVAILERERQNLRKVLNEFVDIARVHSGEADTLRSRLADAEKALLAARMPQPGTLVEDLYKQIQSLEAEKSEFQNTISKLSRTRELTSARLRDLTSEYQGIAEKAELELRRLESELIKMEDARDSALSQSIEKSKEMRAFQKRYDTLKSIAESHREAAVAAKRQAEEAAAHHAKAMEAQNRKVTEAKSAREAAVAELEMLRREHAMLHAAFLRAGGVEEALAVVGAASYASARSTIGGGGGSGGRIVTRNLLRSRTGYCVHARACSAASESVKLTPLPYDSQAALEAAIESQGLFLCSTCVANGSFKYL